MADTESFDELYRASRDRLAVQIAALTGNASDANDVVQEAFMRAWLRWGTVGGYDEPEAWVRRVAHNLAVSRWRKARKLVLRASVPVAPTEIPGQRIPILAALQSLPVAERRAIVLHHVAGLPVTDVAIELGAPEGTVKSWLSRGRVRLATQLDRLDDQPRQHEERPSKTSDGGKPSHRDSITPMTERKVSRVEDELESLVRTGSTGRHWPSGSEIRQRSAQRHRRRVGAAGFGAVVLVIVIAITSAVIVGSTSTSGTSTQGPGVTNHTGVSNHIGSAVELTSLIEQTRTLNSAAEAKVANAEEEFSLKILGQLVTASSSANQLVSPFSLSEALAMSLLGAHGQTSTEIAQALGLSKLSQSEQALGWASLDGDLVAAATHDHIGLNDANSVWTQKGFPIEPAFLNNLKSEFGAGVWQTDFDNDPNSAIRSVNAWVSRETDGQIPSLLQPGNIPNPVAAVLLNAVLFEAQWATQLTNTSKGVFHAPDGNVAATYMSPSVDDGNYLSSFGPDLDAIQLPYWNGTGQQGDRPTSRYAALLLMPTSGSLSQFVESLDAKTLNGIIGGMSSQAADPQVPESKVSSNLQLVPALKALGITDAFGPGADFSGLSTIATQIAEVKQQATLKITKWGTVASAATAVVFAPLPARVSRTLTFNRPFLFMIRDTKTGAILFESAVNNPAAAAAAAG